MGKQPITPRASENFTMILTAHLERDEPARKVLVGVIDRLQQVPGFVFDLPRIEMGKALWSNVDTRIHEFQPQEVFVESLRILSESSSALNFIQMGKIGLGIRQESGDENARETLQSYLDDEGAVFYFWTKEMNKVGLKSPQLNEERILLIEQEGNPVREKIEKITHQLEELEMHGKERK